VNGSQSDVHILVVKRVRQLRKQSLVSSNHAGRRDGLHPHLVIMRVESLFQDGARKIRVRRRRLAGGLRLGWWQGKKWAAEHDCNDAD
jgi:hypothetical protein